MADFGSNLYLYFQKRYTKIIISAYEITRCAELSLETIERQQEDKNEFDKLLAQRQLSEKEEDISKKIEEEGK